MYQPIKAVRSYVQIVAQVEEQITSGQLQIGDKLPSERELAEQFQVSRVVVREAIRDMEARAVVQTRQGSGTYVQTVPSVDLTRSLTLLMKLEKSDLIELMVVRRAIERVTAPLAAQQAAAHQLAALAECLENMTAIVARLHLEESFYAYSKADIKFHLIIAEASHNRPAHTLLSAILPLIKTSRIELFKRSGSFDRFRAEYERQRSQHAEHVAIAGAIQRRDAAAAKASMAAHLDRVTELYRNISSSTLEPKG